MLRAILSALLGLMLTACNLSAATPEPPPSATPGPTRVPVTIDARDNPTDSDDDGDDTTAACTPRTDWLTYTVAAGDTLGSIAERTNSTIAALTQGNCLADPDQLTAGQTLRVPNPPAARLPDTFETYRDPTVGFAFDYPSGWQIDFGGDGGVAVVVVASFNPVNAPSVGPLPPGGSAALVEWSIASPFVTPAQTLTDFAEGYRAEALNNVQVNDFYYVTLSSGLEAARLQTVNPEGLVTETLLTIINDFQIIARANGNAARIDAVFNSLRRA